MQLAIKRVRVRATGNEAAINVSDFNPDLHDELGAAPAPPPEPHPVAPKPSKKRRG